MTHRRFDLNGHSIEIGFQNKHLDIGAGLFIHNTLSTIRPQVDQTIDLSFMQVFKGKELRMCIFVVFGDRFGIDCIVVICTMMSKLGNQGPVEKQARDAFVLEMRPKVRAVQMGTMMS